MQISVLEMSIGFGRPEFDRTQLCLVITFLNVNTIQQEGLTCTHTQQLTEPSSLYHTEPKLKQKNKEDKVNTTRSSALCRDSATCEPLDALFFDVIAARLHISVHQWSSFLVRICNYRLLLSGSACVAKTPTYPVMCPFPLRIALCDHVDHNPPALQTDRQTSCSQDTMLHVALKPDKLRGDCLDKSSCRESLCRGRELRYRC